jgi:hypothetical protein
MRLLCHTVISREAVKNDAVSLGLESDRTACAGVARD